MICHNKTLLEVLRCLELCLELMVSTLVFETEKSLCFPFKANILFPRYIGFVCYSLYYSYCTFYFSLDIELHFLLFLHLLSFFMTFFFQHPFSRLFILRFSKYFSSFVHLPQVPAGQETVKIDASHYPLVFLPTTVFGHRLFVSTFCLLFERAIFVCMHTYKQVCLYKYTHTHTQICIRVCSQI